MMIATDFPSIVKKYAPVFRDCFSAENYEHFQKALSGFILSENKTLTAINRMFVLNLRHQSSFNRFFNRQNFDLAKVNQRRLSLLQANPATRYKAVKKVGGVLSIDDTLLKHYGHHFDHIRKLKDYVNDTYVWAHNLVTLYYSDAQTDYPIHYELWLPPDWEAVALFFKSKNFKINKRHWENRHEQVRKWRRYMTDRFRAGRKKFPAVRQIYRTKTHIAEDLLRQFRKENPDLRFPVALDSSFTTCELCHTIENELQLDYVGALRKEQLLIRAGGVEQTLDDFLTELKKQHKDPTKKPVFRKVGYTYKGVKKFRYAYVANHRIKGYAKKQRLVISFSSEELKSRPFFTITNRRDWYPSGILRIRRHRWPVETYHQEGKAEGLEQYQVRNFTAIETYIALIVVTYSLLKCTVHDADLLSSIQQRLQTETDCTLPFLRRLMKAEVLLALVETIIANASDEQQQAILQMVQPFLQNIAYT